MGISQLPTSKDKTFLEGPFQKQFRGALARKLADCYLPACTPTCTKSFRDSHVFLPAGPGRTRNTNSNRASPSAIHDSGGHALVSISLAAFGVALKRTLALCGAGGPREREAEPALRRAEHLLSRADNDKVCASCSSCARAVTAHGSRSRCALTPARQVSEPLPRACSLPGGRTQVLLRDVHLAEARSRADAS